MKVYLYNAISIDGFIAKNDDDTSWVTDTDWGEFSQIVKDKKAIIMGSRTADISGDDFPYDCELNVVMTHSGDITEKPEDGVWHTDKSPKQVIETLIELGFEECLLIGGGHSNGAFLAENLIDEIIISIHPLVLGQGIKLFEGVSKNLKLEKTSVFELEEDLVQIRYTVIH